MGDPESHKDLVDKMNEITLKNTSREDLSAHVAQNIPPDNAAATTPQDVYPLDKIIFKGDNLAQTLGADAVFVASRMHRLFEMQDDAERMKLMCIFSFINHLIKFNNLKSVDGHHLVRNPEFPVNLFWRFISIFQPRGRSLLKEKRDLLIGYVFVLTLHADGFKTNPTDIAQDLRISNEVLRQHVENLGCSYEFDNVKKQYLAALQLPLKFSEVGRLKGDQSGFI